MGDPTLSFDFDTPAKRKRKKIKMVDVTARFAQNQTHEAIGEVDMNTYISKVEEIYGSDEENRPFVLELCQNCVAFNYGSGTRGDIVPVLGNLAMSLGLNGSEF
ncbi:MAG: hypothetical protein ABW166_13750 [Sedimenticola sp.]